MEKGTPWLPAIIQKAYQALLLSEGVTPDNVLDMSKDTIKVIDALGLSKCDLLGFSLGGFLAQTMAVLRPALFRKIILVGISTE